MGVGVVRRFAPVSAPNEIRVLENPRQAEGAAARGPVVIKHAQQAVIAERRLGCNIARNVT